MINELQAVVVIEGLALTTITLAIFSAFKHWRLSLYIASVVAAISVFCVWSPAMALGSIMVYVPASILLWHEFDKTKQIRPKDRQALIQLFCWISLAVGVALLILKNIYNIYSNLA